MKNRETIQTALWHLRLVSGLAVFLSVVPASFALRDDFNGSTVDTSLWTTSLPFSGLPFGPSALNEGGGSLSFVNRGTLITKDDFGPVDITGRFTITGGDQDMFKIVLRTDGTFTGAYHESANGIAVRWGHVGFNSYNIEFEHRVTPSDGIALADATYPISVNTTYDFRISDDGSRISFYINDFNTPVLSTVTSFDEGNKIALYNRHYQSGAAYSTSLDYVQIVPEPSSGCLLLLGVMGVLARRSRRG